MAALHVLLDNGYSIRVYQSFIAIFPKIFHYMLALCLMLSVTYYAQNYAGIIGWLLPMSYIMKYHVTHVDHHMHYYMISHHFQLCNWPLMSRM